MWLLKAICHELVSFEHYVNNFNLKRLIFCLLEGTTESTSSGTTELTETSVTLTMTATSTNGTKTSELTSASPFSQSTTSIGRVLCIYFKI